jgi:hypothetical protein
LPWTSSTTFVVDPIRLVWRGTARKAVLFAYGKSTLYPMTAEAFPDIMEAKVTHIGH